MASTNRVGVEAVDHEPIVEDVAESHQRHPLVMGHVTLDDGDRCSFREPTRRVVERFSEAVSAARAGFGQALRGCAPRQPGRIIAASAVAYGATTMSSLRPRFRPRPGTPKLEYW